MNELEWSVISLCILYFQLKGVEFLYTVYKSVPISSRFIRNQVKIFLRENIHLNSIVLQV